MASHTKRIPPYCQGILDYLNKLEPATQSESNWYLLQGQQLIDEQGHMEFYLEYGDKECFTLSLRDISDL